jgi:predicted nucleic acid-binding protein
VGIAAGREFLIQVQQSNTVVARVRAADAEQARKIVLRYADKDSLLASASNFVVMERPQIHQAFTFDQQFAKYSFTVLVPGTLSRERGAVRAT